MASVANHDKRSEWLEFRAKYPKDANWKDFYEWAKDPKSAFHDDVEWNQKRAAEEYYRKRCLNLIIQYDRLYVNVESSYQRLHASYDIPSKEAGVRKRVARTAAQIERNEDELAIMRAAIWSRLRRAVSDMHDFRNSLPEFNEILEFLTPRVASEMTRVDGSVRSGAAAH